MIIMIKSITCLRKKMALKVLMISPLLLSVKGDNPLFSTEFLCIQFLKHIFDIITLLCYLHTFMVEIK
jgi:hypothetical protein